MTEEQLPLEPEPPAPEPYVGEEPGTLAVGDRLPLAETVASADAMTAPQARRI